MNVYRYTWNNPVMWRDPSGLSVAIEYGCLAQFGLGAGAMAGSTSALGAGGLFTTVAKALAAATGEIDKIAEIAEIEAQWQKAEVVVTATSLAVELALAGSRCGKHKSKKPPTCKAGPRRRSFGEGTPVATIDGLKPNEQVRVGDEVKAVDPSTGPVAWKTVTERHERMATAGVVRLTMEDAFGERESLTATHNHCYLCAASAALVGTADSRLGHEHAPSPDGFAGPAFAVCGAEFCQRPICLRSSTVISRTWRP